MSNIQIEDFITASGKYPERLIDFPENLRPNAERLLIAINSFLKELQVIEVKVSSGYRPESVNSKIPNAAKKSLHMQCLAVDIEDKDGKLDELFKQNPEVLRKYDLFLESPDHTPNWSHLDLGSRADRPSRVFIP